MSEQNAMAAGAQAVVDLLGNSSLRTPALAYVASLGGVDSAYDGSNPVSEMAGVDGILEHCRKVSGQFIGNAPSVRVTIQARIDAEKSDAPGRETEPEAPSETKGRGFKRTTKPFRAKSGS